MSTHEPAPLLNQLEEALRPHAHGLEALTAIRDFVQALPNTKARADLLNSSGALVTPPIDCAEAKRLEAYPQDADIFWILAGDIISTDAAFTLGERITPEQLGVPRPKFIVASATCDLVPGRKRTKALLFEVHPIYKPQTEEEQRRLKGQIGSLVSYKERHYMYLPPLPGDEENVVANVVSFDDFAIARTEDLVMAQRIATLSTPGWRIFAALLRINLTREGEYESDMRTRFGTQSGGSGIPSVQTGIQA